MIFFTKFIAPIRFLLFTFLIVLIYHSPKKKHSTHKYVNNFKWFDESLNIFGIVAYWVVIDSYNINQSIWNVCSVEQKINSIVCLIVLIANNDNYKLFHVDVVKLYSTINAIELGIVATLELWFFWYFKFKCSAVKKWSQYDKPNFWNSTTNMWFSFSFSHIYNIIPMLSVIMFIRENHRFSTCRKRMLYG